MLAAKKAKGKKKIFSHTTAATVKIKPATC